MTVAEHDEAMRVLGDPASSIAALMRAVGTLAQDPRTADEDLLPALTRVDCVAEQAAMALHRRTSTPWYEGHPITDPMFWAFRLSPAYQMIERYSTEDVVACVEMMKELRRLETTPAK